MKSILVFCGSSKGAHPIYQQTAYDLGKAFAQRGIRLVYGAGNVGLMGTLADAVLEHGGKVMGIIPHFLKEKEVCHLGLTELIVVESMAQRKLEMAKHSNGVITLPGGYGTLDELFEMLTLMQISQLDQPIGILNVNGYFDHLLAQIDLMVQEKFLKAFHRDLLIASDNMEELITQVINYQPTGSIEKWIDRA